MLIELYSYLFEYRELYPWIILRTTKKHLEFSNKSIVIKKIVLHIMILHIMISVEDTYPDDLLVRIVK